MEDLSDSKLEEALVLKLQQLHIRFRRSIDILEYFYNLYFWKSLSNPVGDYVNHGNLVAISCVAQIMLFQ